MRGKSDDQPDAEFQEKGFRRAGYIAGCKIRNGQPQCARHAAPGSAEEECREHDEGIAEVECRFLTADGQVKAEKLETDVGERRKQCRIGEAFGAVGSTVVLGFFFGKQPKNAVCKQHDADDDQKIPGKKHFIFRGDLVVRVLPVADDGGQDAG